MSIFKTLLYTRVASMFSSMFSGSRKKKPRGLGFKVLIALFTIYIIGALGSSFGLLFYSLCVPLHDAGLSWFYFALMGLMAILFGFMGSVFATQSQLFEAKDNELLLSMPIPPHMILASRIFLLLLVNYLYGAFITIPAGVVYLMHYKVTAIEVIFFLLIVILLPFLVLSISCIFAWLLAWITSKIKYKNIFTLILSMGFLALYIGVYSQIQKYLMILIENGETIAASIKKVLPPIYHLGNAIAERNLASLLIFIMFAIIPFMLVYYVLSRNFIKILTRKKGSIKLEYKGKSLKVSSAKKALLKKELSLFVSSPMYIMNASMGAIFMILLAIMLVVKKEVVLALLVEIPQADIFLSTIAILGLSTLATLNIISAPSISLEGRNLWIPQSLPVDAGEILLSKAMAHIVVCLPPVLLASTACAIFLPMGSLQVLLVFLLPSIVTIYSGLFGVLVNLHFPKFDWISETAAVKQSASTLLSMFGSGALILILALFYIYVLEDFINIDTYLIVCFVLFVILSYGIYKFLTRKGKKMFGKL